MGNGEGGDEIRVGYALPPKKVDTLITPSLVAYAQKRAIHLVPIDLHKHLINQGPFHCLVHKIYSDDWNRQLLDFKSKYPNTVIIDSPDAIQRLHNRISMLDFVNQLSPLPFPISFGIPQQIVVDDNNAQLLNDPTNLLRFLSFPVIAKPLIADGSAKSHEMSLVFNANALIKLKLEPPIVLQEFVNHGGVVFKVYVAGNHVKCAKRRSLPDVSPELESQAQGGILTFSQISNLADVKDANSLEEAEMPPMDLVESMAKKLRQALRLHLFNFDMIMDRWLSARIRYLIIDINYFPGYAKLPDYETMLTDFLYDVVKHTHDNKDGSLQLDADVVRAQLGNATEC